MNNKSVSFEELSLCQKNKIVNYNGYMCQVVKPLTYGSVLIKYLDKSPWSTQYFIWSNGGGSSAANTKNSSIKIFNERVEFFKKSWLNTLNKNKSIIVNGHHYMDGGNSPNKINSHLGFCGNVFTIQSLSDPLNVWQTNNLWHQGKIPKEFDKKDTHRFILDKKSKYA